MNRLEGHAWLKFCADWQAEIDKRPASEMIDVQTELTPAQRADGIMQQIAVLRHVAARLRVNGQHGHGNTIAAMADVLTEEWEELDAECLRILERGMVG